MTRHHPLFSAVFLIFGFFALTVVSVHVTSTINNHNNINNINNHNNHNNKKGAEPGLYDLIPGRLNDTISFGEVLRSIPSTDDGQRAIRWLINFFEQKTGITFPAPLVQQILSRADLLLNFVALTVKQMRAAIDALNLAYQNGLIPPPEPKMELALPSPFVLENLSSINIDLLQYQAPLSEIGADILHGYSNSSETPEQLLGNIRFAAVLQSFVRNYVPNPNGTITAPKHVINNQESCAKSRKSSKVNILREDQQVEEEGFSVMYKGKVYSDPGDLLLGLHEDGHQVSGHFSCRAADFFGLWKRVGDKIYPIAAPFMIVTGVNEYNSSRKVTLPAFHCELVVNVQANKSSDSNLNVDVAWFEGTGGIGFIADKMNALTQWAGTVDRHPLTVEQVAEAVRLGTLFAEVLLDTEKRFNLYLMGYGATGACTDSVGILLQILLKKPLVFPFLMRKDYLVTVLKEKLSVEPNERKAYGYFQLLQAVKAIPVDYQNTDSEAERILGSFPWEKDQEPFYSAATARKTLDQIVSTQITSSSSVNKIRNTRKRFVINE